MHFMIKLINFSLFQELTSNTICKFSLSGALVECPEQVKTREGPFLLVLGSAIFFVDTFTEIIKADHGCTWTTFLLYCFPCVSTMTSQSLLMDFAGLQPLVFLIGNFLSRLESLHRATNSHQQPAVVLGHHQGLPVCQGLTVFGTL